MRAFVILVVVALVGCGGDDGPETMMMTGTDAGPPDPGVDGGPPDPGDPDSGPPDPGDPDSGMEPPDPPGDAPITLSGSCPDFDPCGGDEDGRWEYAEVCAEPDFEAVREACPAAMIEGMGTVRGTVVFAGGVVTRSATSHVEATVTFPASCGVTPYCAALGAMIGGTCAPSGADCVCDVVDDGTTSESDPYTVDGNQIVLSDGTRYDYCVDGGRLTYRELGDSPSERGVAELSR
jgi:hypothetical protein